MGKSIIQDEKQCYFCGRVTGLETHHVFGGVANRPISEKYGLKIWLCHECHTGNEGAQYDKMKNLQLKQDAQYAFEREHTRAEWMKLIGKNYL
jgi:Zn-finger protein